MNRVMFITAEQQRGCILKAYLRSLIGPNIKTIFLNFKKRKIKTTLVENVKGEGESMALMIRNLLKSHIVFIGAESRSYPCRSFCFKSGLLGSSHFGLHEYNLERRSSSSVGSSSSVDMDFA